MFCLLGIGDDLVAIASGGGEVALRRSLNRIEVETAGGSLGDRAQSAYFD